MSRRKRISGFDWNKIPWTPIIIVGTLWLGKETIIDPLLNLFGLSSEDKKLHDEKQELQFETRQYLDEAVNDWWWTGTIPGTIKYFKSITEGTRKGYADELRALTHSFVFGDSWARVMAIFKALPYKTQVSRLSLYYRERYGVDLITEIRGQFQDSQVKQLVDLVRSYKNGQCTDLTCSVIVS